MNKRFFAAALIVGTQAASAYAGINVNLNVGASPAPSGGCCTAPPPVAPLLRAS